MVVNDAMVDYVMSKYCNKWYHNKEMFEVILEDLWKRENNQHDHGNDKGLENLEAIAKLSKRVSKLEVMFGSLKEVKQAKMAMEAEAIAKLDEVFGKGQEGRGSTQRK
ncbi:hypothetical protein CTI12_AA153900 [Artemisia annua]|uniref:Uncharacterized protein n=1 Tax=Artemisia annua TaxID=35608 RepID=A0A2U1PGQ5_ARTAN|nr:hypothetical protein CTI12_AA153900 [Artemisia annua]